MSKQLWLSTIESDGIPFGALYSIVIKLNDVGEDHLPRVDVPSDLELGWDFVSAVSDCVGDATYHKPVVYYIYLTSETFLAQLGRLAVSNGIAGQTHRYEVTGRNRSGPVSNRGAYFDASQADDI
ncbi:hypothetical protein ACEPAG_3939 [Sanghuangporus baumii]